MRKKKRKLTNNQKKAHKRNWSKGAIVGTLKRFDSVMDSKSLSFVEQVKLARCKKQLREILADWKPVL